MPLSRKQYLDRAITHESPNPIVLPQDELDIYLERSRCISSLTYPILNYIAEVELLTKFTTRNSDNVSPSLLRRRWTWLHWFEYWTDFIRSHKPLYTKVDCIFLFDFNAHSSAALYRTHEPGYVLGVPIIQPAVTYTLNTILCGAVLLSRDCHPFDTAASPLSPDLSVPDRFLVLEQLHRQLHAAFPLPPAQVVKLLTESFPRGHMFLSLLFTWLHELAHLYGNDFAKLDFAGIPTFRSFASSEPLNIEYAADRQALDALLVATMHIMYHDPHSDFHNPSGVPTALSQVYYGVAWTFCFYHTFSPPSKRPSLVRRWHALKRRFVASDVIDCDGLDRGMVSAFEYAADKFQLSWLPEYAAVLTSPDPSSVEEITAYQKHIAVTALLSSFATWTQTFEAAGPQIRRLLYTGRRYSSDQLCALHAAGWQSMPSSDAITAAELAALFFIDWSNMNDDLSFHDGPFRVPDYQNLASTAGTSGFYQAAVGELATLAHNTLLDMRGPPGYVYLPIHGRPPVSMVVPESLLSRALEASDIRRLITPRPSYKDCDAYYFARQFANEGDQSCLDHLQVIPPPPRFPL